MQIELTQAEEAEIRRQASAVGYEDPGRYLVDLAVKPDGARAPMTDAELKASAAKCDHGMKDAAAGRGVPMREAIAGIADELGLPTPKPS